MAKIKLTMEMSAGGAYPATDIPAMKENVFHLIKRIELSLLSARFDLSMDNKDLSLDMYRALFKSFDEDLARTRELLSSLKIEVA